MAMVINSRSCSNAGWWSRHVQNAEKNERVEIVGFYGLSARNIEDAFSEMRLMAQESKADNFFSSYNINPVEKLTEAQWEEAHALHRKNHGLDDLPYFRVRHIKDGREHEHGFALRVDPENGKAISDSLTAAINERTSRELEIRFGLERGHSVLEPDREEPRPERRPEKWEQFRGNESGLDPAAIGRELASIKERSDNGQSLKAGMEAAGYILARGDRRDFMVIDQAADEHSLARRLGIKAAELRDFMKDVDPASLPSVEQAKTQQLARAAELEQHRAQAGRYDDIRPEQVQQAAREGIRPVFEATAARTTEPATPIFDRDAAERRADEKIVEAAIAAAQEARQRPEAAAKPAPDLIRGVEKDVPAAHGPYADLQPPQPIPQTKPEPALGKTAGDIRMTWSLSQSASELQEGLAARGLGLGLASAEEARQSQRTAAFVKEVGNYARIVREGEIVAIDGFGQVYRLDERTTGQTPREIEGRLAGLDRGELLNIAETKEALREAALAAWAEEKIAARERARLPNRIESRIAECGREARRDVTIGYRDGEDRLASRAEALADSFKPEDEQKIRTATVTGAEAFAARIDEAGIAVTRVTETDIKAVDALRHDESMARVAAETNNEARKTHHFATDLVAGDMAAVTRDGDVYKINPDKLGDAKQYLAAELPGVTETRARFEIEREQTSALWNERRAESATSRADFAAERESHHQAAETARHTRQFNHEMGEAVDTGFKATGGILRGMSRALESFLSSLADFFFGPPKLTKDQAERAERVAEERHGEQAAAADRAQTQEDYDRLAEAQRTKDIARTLQVDPDEDDRFRQIMQKAARADERDRERDYERDR